jgi:hypothetical protein
MSNDFEMSNDDKRPLPASETGENKSKEKEVKPPKSKYSPEELLQIFDEMIFAGGYSEQVTIRGKLNVGFRTRNAEEVESISMKLDSSGVNLINTANEKRSLLNLHYALISYQGKDLSSMKIEEKISYINKLPAPIIGSLIAEMIRFDTKVYAACEEGETNF